ncbi:UdgX family uracil-DNA binding protein [Microvirga sp. 3-52]|uniref:UdgX family uracil-DNA binding protein n=1 Tax=Microvirga sp. 3-52 TaxID=2792425 RepID=UPI001ACA0FA9|nr:UdgX family uracil-DNA binding protein [Microvirga sp. 3-52]MBO1905704.1 UdgX family uracil-DNA binding protein [Microvirga sp. 3-52]MBS7452999.1 UdgX family uracil-DNA binding protein [Microvirga sp. 3-52]
MSLHRITLKTGADLDGYRRAVRRLIAEELAPQHVVFAIDDAPGLFGRETAGDAPAVSIPKGVARLIEHVVCHHDPERYALLYQLVWRVQNGERDLLEIASDPLVHRIDLMARSVRRDLHKMHAFVRFRRMPGEHLERFAAWFEPEHFILEAAAPFFIDRFRSMDWTILTPIGSLRWNREKLAFGPPAQREDAPAEDSFEEGWRGYYESVFNPARVNPTAMRAEMPKKYWRNMPETAAIPGLIQTASQRVERMIEQEATMPTKRTPERALEAMWDQEPKSLKELNAVIAKAGPLVPGATQAVFGEGPAHAEIVFVGEQPGDQEDLQGRPFVGPAGKLFTKAMTEAGIDRKDVYLTNAVKHFKFEQRGHRRIHSKPTAGEVKHYRPWLMKELELVKPKLVVALGGTALLALTGKSTPITRSRGRARFGSYEGYVTVHPSYLLRLPDEATKREAYEAFLNDLRRVHDLAQADLETGELPLAAE